VGEILDGCSAEGFARCEDPFTVVYCAVATFIILKVIDVVMGLRVSEEQETEGLDLALHDERGYNL